MPACHAGGRGFESRPVRQHKFYSLSSPGRISSAFALHVGPVLTGVSTVQDPGIEMALRLGFFVAILVLLALTEQWLPRRPRVLQRRQRWSGNLGLVLINTLVLRLLFPAAAVGMALFVEERGWGLFQILTIPGWLIFLLSLLLLDFVIWLQHVMLHAIPVLWRLHRVHHADPEFDVSTGLRFHPFEIVLSLLVKFVAIAALGIPAVAVLVFEILLNACAMFNHANLKLPLGLDRLARKVIVTPDMHRVHHSVIPNETNSNFGFCLSCWDRLLGTYLSQPKAGHNAMQIGVSGIAADKSVALLSLLLLPWQRYHGNYEINQRK